MRWLRRAPLALCWLLWPALLVAQRLPRATPESLGMSSARLARLGRMLDAYVATDRLPGGVVLVARGGRVVYEHAFGERDVEAHDPMRDDAIFRIASQSKAIVSVAILMLQEEGRLLIGDPLSKYLPAFAHTTVAVPRDGGGYDVVDARRPITLRDLLTHTSGVSYGGGPAADRWKAAGITGWYFADRDEPIQATVNRMAELPFDTQPGERFVYGYSLDILGAVVEVASGEPLDRFLRTHVFEPLGMEDTYFYLPGEKAGRLATVYNLPRGGELARAPDGPGMETQGQYVEGPRKSFSGGAGLVSTAEDYARFLQAMLNGGQLGGHRILSPETVRLMTVDHLGDRYPAAGLGFGLGFEVVTDLGAQGAPGSVGKYGWGGAYHSTYWVDPAEQLVVVYFTQVIPAWGLDDHGKVRALVYAAITDEPAPTVGAGPGSRGSVRPLQPAGR